MGTCQCNEIRRVERAPAQLLDGLDLKAGSKSTLAQGCNLIGC